MSDERSKISGSYSFLLSMWPKAICNASCRSMNLRLSSSMSAKNLGLKKILSPSVQTLSIESSNENLK